MIKMRSELLPKLQVARSPDVDFGVSAEAPEFFQKEHTMISRRSYRNPFVGDSRLGLEKIVERKRGEKVLTETREWTSRPHLSNFSQMKYDGGFLTGRRESGSIAPGLNHSMEFERTFEVMVDQSNGSKVFHKKKGEFTTYFENHVGNVDFSGPILGGQRSPERAQKMKERVLKEKQEKLQRTKQKYSRLKPNRSLSPLLQKTKIHRSRLRLNEQVHSQYQQKQNLLQKSLQFQLPKINRQQLQQSLYQMSRHYKKFKNDKLTRSFFASALSSVKTAELDRSGLISKRVGRVR